MSPARSSPLERLLGALDRAGERSTAEEVADLLWLAAKLPSRRVARKEEARRAPPLLPPPIPDPPVRESVPPSRGEKFGPTVTSVASREQQEASATFYPSTAASQTEGGISARLVRSPGAVALPGALELGRSLRPLKRKVPSRVRMAFDEAATAHRVAASGDWTPVFRPAPERWLDLVLVVEESSSMIIWERTLTELRRLFERQGAFRSIDVLGYRPDAVAADVELYRGIGARAQRDRRVSERSLRDGSGRRLIAVVSDCVSAPWHDGRMAGLLAGWGRQHLVAIAQVLPASLWVRTGLRSFPSVYSRSPAPGAPNATCEVEWTNYKPSAGTRGGIAVPVMSLEAVSLDHWARSIAGNSNLWIPAVFVASPEPSSRSLAAPSTPSAPGRATTTPDAAQLVRNFYGTATPTARRLASLLAAAPLTLPVMRLVQQAMLPESRQVHLAEVWLSGLIDRPKGIELTSASEHAEFAFVSGVRELLLDNLHLGDVVHVLGAVSGYIGERIGQPLDFRALVADPGAQGDVQVAQGYQSFARVAASALRRFGGAYADLASRLEVSVYGESLEVVQRETQVQVEHHAEAEVPAQADGRRTARIRALLVGINEHESSGMVWQKGAVNDMLLTRSWLGETFGVAPDDLTVLLDRGATKANVMTALRRCVAGMERGDHLYFHFSGNDHAIATTDPNEADGLEETLFLNDSVAGERATLLTHQELADIASGVDARGGRVTIVLDCCRAASGYFARRALRNTIVVAGSAEMETAEEMVVDGVSYGAFSWALAQVMGRVKRGVTWHDIHDQVVVQLRARGLRQTPQLIGRGDLEVLGRDHRPVPPYLLVARADEREVEVLASPALDLDRQKGMRLAIYAPGSPMSEAPLDYGTVTRATEHGVVALLSSGVAIPPGSRVRIEREDHARLLSVEPHGGEFLVMDSGTGERLWQADGHAVSSRQQANAIVRDMMTWLSALRLSNNEVDPAVRERLSIEVGMQEGHVVTPGALPIRVTLRNQSHENLYVSLFMMDDHLGIERVLPPTSPCLVLGTGREMTVALSVKAVSDGAPTRLTFKAFASREPMDLGVLSLPGFPQRFDAEKLTSLAAAPEFIVPAPARFKKKGEARSSEWVPGGQAALAGKVWPNGSTLRLRFLDGTPALQKLVMDAALEWTQNANLRFKLVNSGPAEVRVSFADEGSWSYMGTDALSVKETDPTINFGSMTQTPVIPQLRRIVLHEFGHALGLVAANMSPVANIPWRKEATYAYFAKEGWDRQTVDHNIFAKYQPREVIQGGVDPLSIMYHPAPTECLEPGFEFYEGHALSPGDRAFIAKLYPMTAEHPAPSPATRRKRSAPPSPPVARRKSRKAAGAKRAGARAAEPARSSRSARRTTSLPRKK